MRTVSEKLVRDHLPGETTSEFLADPELNRNRVGGYVISGKLEQKSADGETAILDYVVSFDDMHGKMPRAVIVDRKLTWKAESLPADAEELKLAEPIKDPIEADADQPTDSTADEPASDEPASDEPASDEPASDEPESAAADSSESAQ